MDLLIENDRGYLAFDGNELIVGSKVDDPPKVRLTSPMTEHGGGGGAVSFNFHRDHGRAVDGHDQIEMGMIRVEQADDVRGQIGNPKGELNVLLNDGGLNDWNMRKPLAFVWNAITRCLLNVAGTSRTDTMWAPSGLFFTQQQDDGNVVSYKVDRPFDKGANPVALWSSWNAK